MFCNVQDFPRSEQESDDDEPGVVIPSELFQRNNNNNWSYNRYHPIQSLVPTLPTFNEPTKQSRITKPSKPSSDFQVITEILQDINLEDCNSLKDLVQLKQALLATMVKVDSKVIHSVWIQLTYQISDAQERLEEQILCVICQERYKEITLDPCGHMSSCSECASALASCPICRTKPNKLLRTFWS